MKTGVKVAIGCGVLAVVGLVVVIALVGGAAWWAKGKVQEVTGDQSRIEELQKKANANPYTRPADGLIKEDRLLKFLEIRKRVFTVYEKYKGEIEKRGEKKEADFSDVTKGLSVLNEVRTAQAQAQADLGMSDDEYRFHVEQVYKSMWVNEWSKSNEGKQPSQAISEAMAKATEEIEKQRASAQGAAAQTQGQADKETSEQASDAQKQMGEMLSQMKKGAEELQKESKEWDIPEANLALFRKYETDIKKYAMGGLELLGL